jgi:Uncharacterised nucleotidyltransferase
MLRSYPQLLPLFQAAAQGRKNVPLATLDTSCVHWALETGLGPLLFHVTQEDPQAPTSPLWPLLRGADLTAQVLIAEHLEAMGEILDACQGRVQTITLLKGISIAEQYYPLPYLRLMRDIDFLIAETDLPAVEGVLSALGYSQPFQQSERNGVSFHHGNPFVHQQKGIWVEVHWGLFSSLTPFGADRLFQREHLTAQLQSSTFQGRNVMRLSDEMQLVYIASHWARDHNLTSVLGATIAMLDIIYLLRHRKRPLDWEKIFEWLHSSVVTTPLYLLLTYLQRYRLIDVAPEILTELSRQQSSFGPPTLVILHSLIDRYMVDGRSYGPMLNERNLSILWSTLLLPGPPWRNLLRVPWHLLPSRHSISRLFRESR